MRRHISPPPLPPVEVVLDTNVVLDWLLFQDVQTKALGTALETGSFAWIGTASMLHELSDVLGRAEFDRWHHRRASVLPGAQKYCWLRPDPVVGASHALWCTDPDDQQFIDLALSAKARWLFSRDKAVLRLARRARAFGVQIASPAQWPTAAA